jgi:hypothetical protein
MRADLVEKENKKLRDWDVPLVADPETGLVVPLLL